MPCLLQAGHGAAQQEEGLRGDLDDPETDGGIHHQHLRQGRSIPITWIKKER